MNRKNRQQKTYIDSCWNEIEKPKKKIRYVSKTNENDNVQSRDTKNQVHPMKGFFKLFLIAILFFYFTSRANQANISAKSDSEYREQVSMTTTMEESDQNPSFNTYIDGLEFAKMMKTLQSLTTNRDVSVLRLLIFLFLNFPFLFHFP